VFLRSEATETVLSKYGERFRYIHFATHGEFDADKPLNSALLLAMDSESYGRLTVNKLYSLKLNADLVTLIACETGLGKIVNGDDSSLAGGEICRKIPKVGARCVNYARRDLCRGPSAMEVPP
jgi:CHAT domain-containing protein